MRNTLVTLMLCLCAIEPSEQYNILVVFTHFGKSHFLVFKPLFEKLAIVGHNVTVISYFPSDKVIPNYRDIDLNDGGKMPEEILHIDQFVHSRAAKYTSSNLLVEYATVSCTQGLSSKNFQQFLKEDNHFDLLLVEVFNTNCFYGVAKKYDAPIIGLSTSNLKPWMSSFFGFPENPSYMNCIYLDFSDRMSFIERVENTICIAYSILNFNYRLVSPGYEYSKKYTGIDMVQEIDPQYNMSLMLINTHLSFTRPRPFTSNIIEVGGIHIAPQKPLPRYIENYVDESKDGVIYMSMGSMLKGHTFPKDKKEVFLRVFSRLPQRVIWKWENETIEGNPGNVMTLKWAPQRDIICHPNVKVFISHGGLLGSLEALSCGIPVIVMPQYGDQPANAKLLEAAGAGIILYFDSITEDSILTALRTALTPEFRNKSKAASDRFNDRLVPPMDTALYWINYVVRHKGAPHMRSAAMDLPFYQYYLLDVAAFFFIVMATVIYVIIYISKLFFISMFGSSIKVSKQKRD